MAELEEFMVQYWLQAIFTVMITYLTYKIKKIKKDYTCKVKELNSLKLGLQALLRNEIIHEYNKYVKELKWIPIYAMDNINMMFDQYKALGGNGTVHDLIEEMRELKHYPPGELNNNINKEEYSYENEKSNL